MGLVGKRTIPALRVYEIITNNSFTDDVSDVQGHHMYKMIVGNLHVFSAKQQKHLESRSCRFCMFRDVQPPQKLKKSGGARDRSRSRGSSSASRVRRSQKQSAPSSEPAMAPDPRMRQRGAM